MERVNGNVDKVQVFVIISKGGMKINAGLNAKNWSIKVYTVKDLLETLVIVSVNTINRVELMNI